MNLFFPFFSVITWFILFSFVYKQLHHSFYTSLCLFSGEDVLLWGEKQLLKGVALRVGVCYCGRGCSNVGMGVSRVVL